MSMPVVLVDFDDTIFPLSHAYAQWLKQHYELKNRWFQQLRSDQISRIPSHVRNAGQKLRLDKFFEDDQHYHTPPITSAVEGLSSLSQHYRIICCTNRSMQQLRHQTETWLDKHFHGVVQEVEYARGEHHSRGMLPKRHTVRRTKAVALIDDMKLNMFLLPSSCQGLLVKRQTPLFSDPGAVGWEKIVETLQPQ